MRIFIVALLMSSALATGCGKRVPEPANVAPGTPHVTWVLMYGDRDNPDAEFACQSDPRTDCALPVSRAGADVFSHFHAYYHGAGAAIRYEGTMELGFLRGEPASHRSQINATVQKDESITNQSVTGIVTSTPGTYAVTFSLTATAPNSEKKTPIRETIQVSVK